MSEEKEIKLEFSSFLKRNETYILIFVAILAILSISFEYINNINKSYAGYLTITICIISGLLILEMLPKGNETFTIKSLIFFGGIITIAIIIILVTMKIYGEEYQQIFNLAYTITSITIGAVIAYKLFIYSKKYKKNLSSHIIFLAISISLWIFFKYFISIPNYIAPSWTFTPLLILFLTGFGFIIILFGIFGGGKEILKILIKEVKKISIVEEIIAKINLRRK